MRLFILKFILILSYNLFAQETKFITRRSSEIKKSKEAKGKDRNTLAIGLSRDFIEEYYVLKSDENIRHGTYVKYRQTFRGIQILESGSYQNGQQNGPWEYYHDIPMKNSANSLKGKGQFVNGRKNGVWTTYYADTLAAIVNEERFGSKKKTDSISIQIDQQSARLKTAGMYLNDKRIGEWTTFTYSGNLFQKFDFSKNQLIIDHSIKDTLKYNTNRSALFIGGLPSLIDFLAHEFQLTGSTMIKAKNDSTSVIVSFTIDKNGSVYDTKIDESNGYLGFEREAIRITNLTVNNWIPAISDSKPIDSTYKLQFSIIRKHISPTHKTFRIAYKPILE